jgi:alkylation response protein AidB-like acyl-CoA dehydrogenase
MASGLDSAEDLLDAARNLRRQIDAAVSQIDRESRLPDALVADLKRAGLFRILVPRVYGGSEATLLKFSEVIEEVAKSDASTAWCLGQNAGITRVSAYLPAPVAEGIFGRKDFSIAWGQGQARAVKVPGGYRLTGRWAYASGIRHATWAGCQDCPVTDQRGEPIRDANGAQERRIFVFPVSEVEVLDVWNVSGLRGTGSDSFRVTELLVPEERSPGPEPQVPGPLYVFNTTNLFSVAFASVALGAARATLDAFCDIATTKAPRGIGGVLREQQTVQVHVAQCEAALRASRAYVREAIATAWEEARATHELSIPARIDLRLSTTYAIRQASSVAERLHYLAGTSALEYGGPIERRVRDMHAITQHIQGREDHFEPPGQYLLGLPPSPRWL